MKQKTVFLFLILLLGLSACGKDEQENKEKQQEWPNSQETGLGTEGIRETYFFSDNEPLWLTQRKLEEELLGMKKEEVRSLWGKPDHSPEDYSDPAIASITDDYYYLENGWQVALGYNHVSEGEEVTWVVSGIVISNREENEPLYYGYSYPVEDELMALSPPSVTLAVHENTFTYYWHPLSSYIGYGEYEVKGDALILRTSDGKYHYCFTIDGDNLIFNSNKSSTTGMADIPDGAVFVPNGTGVSIQEKETIEESGFGRYSDYQTLFQKRREGNLGNSN